MQKLFDSHAHYTDQRFNESLPDGLDGLLTALFANEVGCIVNAATNLSDAGQAIALAQKYPKMYATAGIHPGDIRDDMELDDEIERLRSLLGHAKENKIVAVGEIGLDYYWLPVNKPRQHAFFERQLEVAEEFALPVVIHDRDAHGDCFDAVLRHPRVRGVFHSYSGSAEMATELVRRGWYISFSGVLTYKNARKTVEAAEAVPLDRILIETDCPYLTPHPHRGQLNHSGLMIHTAQKLAEIKGLSLDEVIRTTYSNVALLFGLITV